MSEITLEQLDFAEKEATMGFTPTCWGVDLFNLARDGIKCRNSHAALVAVCNEAADALSEGLNPIEMDGLVAKLRAAGRDGK